jgi:hypothetical protein
MDFRKFNSWHNMRSTKRPRLASGSFQRPGRPRSLRRRYSFHTRIMTANSTDGKSGSLSQFSHLDVNQGFQGSQVFKDCKGNTCPVAGTGQEFSQPQPEVPRPTREELLRGAVDRDSLADLMKAIFEASLENYGDFDRANRDEWQSDMLPVVRWLRSLPTLAKLDAPAAWKNVAKVVQGWRGKTCDQWWIAYIGIGEEDAQVEFLHWWDKIRCLPNGSSLEYALYLADLRPIMLQDDIVTKRSQKYPRFVNMCAHLQKGAGRQKNIFLPIEAIGELLGVTPMSVSRYREWAIKDDYLKLVTTAKRNPKGPGRAAEYRFNLWRFRKCYGFETISDWFKDDK